MVVRGADTVAVERFVRTGTTMTGELTLSAGIGQRERYHLVVAPDATAPLVELSVWRRTDPVQSPARQQTRVIFRDDSVAVDDVTSRGMNTLLFGTTKGAMPYLNLSFAFLEQAMRRAASLGSDSVSVPFFNLGGGTSGGQTVTASVRRVGSDSVALDLGTVEFRLEVDAAGRLLGGGIPAQQIRVIRQPQ
ncbi:MAG: hypothetical protein ACREMO_11265 [Gemmatimonadales bacterium]